MSSWLLTAVMLLPYGMIGQAEQGNTIKYAVQQGKPAYCISFADFKIGDINS